MGNALLSGVSGLAAHQTMLNVAGNNLANINTNGFKGSRATFAEQMAQTLRQAQAPSDTTGGTNPVQVGSGVVLDSVDRDMGQGDIVDTGQPLDMAIEGAGFFVLSDGIRDIYTRVGSFAVDSDFRLVDPATGYRVQRIGNEGVQEGFQDANTSDIRIPYDVALPSKQTDQVTYSGNVSSDDNSATTNILSSGVQYTVNGAPATESARLANLDQANGLAAGDSIAITGADRTGQTVSATFTLTTGDESLGDLVAAIGGAFDGSHGAVSNGEVRLVDEGAGYSQTDMMLSYTGGGTLELPDYFRIISAGGAAAKTTSIEIFDTQGVGHILSTAFVRKDTNAWDMVLTSISGDVDQLVDRRIEDIAFRVDGSFGGVSGGDSTTFQIVFGHDPGNVRALSINLGSVGEFGGLTQFGGDSTAAANRQDGYPSGYLSSLAVTRDGVLSGVFTNGIRKDLAAIKLATFQNPAGLASVGNGYWEPTGNSGDALVTKAMGSGAGAIRGSSLETSNVDMAKEFVHMIEAQNGYQANARAIRVANDMLRELSQLIR